MSKYKIITYWSDIDNAFIAEVPELPSCMADGKTRQEAIENAETIIFEWIEIAQEDGEELPHPQSKGNLLPI